MKDITKVFIILGLVGIIGCTIYHINDLREKEIEKEYLEGMKKREEIIRYMRNNYSNN